MRRLFRPLNLALLPYGVVLALVVACGAIAACVLACAALAIDPVTVLNRE